MSKQPSRSNTSLAERLARLVARGLARLRRRDGQHATPSNAGKAPTDAEVAQAVRLLKGQVEVLEALAQNVPAADVLTSICTGAYLYAGRIPCAALRLGAEAKELSVAAAAGVEKGFAELTGNATGTDGTFQSLALRRYGLKVHQTAPIVGTEGELFGFFELYGTTPHDRPIDETWITVTARLAALAFEKERREQQIADQRAMVTQSAKMASLGEMAAGIAHEINNPLTVINGRVAQLTPMLTGVAPELRLDAGRALDSIGKMTSRIQTIIKNLRAFSRNVEEDERTPVRVKTVIDDTLSYCQERFRAADVALTVVAVDPTLEFFGRAQQIEQVLLNLLSNAFDAVEGRIDRRVTLEVVDEGQTVAVFVTDSGGGVPEAAHSKVFQPFFTTKEVNKGTGLGLSISLGIARAHGGTLELHNASTGSSGAATGRRGATFVLRLPKRPRNYAANDSAENESAA